MNEKFTPVDENVTPEYKPGEIAYVSEEKKKSDVERAHQLKSDLTLALQNVIEVMNRSHSYGLVCAFQLQQDQFGKYFIGGNGITVAKYL